MLRYDLTNDIYHKFQYLNDDVLTGAINTPLDTLDELKSALSDENDKSQRIEKQIDNRIRRLWYVKESDTYYLARTNEDNSLYAQKAESLKPIYNNPDDTGKLDIELKIVPAPMHVFVYESSGAWQSRTAKIWMQLPVPDVCDPLFEVQDFPDEYTLEDIVEDKVSLESDNVSDRMLLTFYSGLKKSPLIYNPPGNT